MSQPDNQLQTILTRDLTEIKDMKTWLAYYGQLVDAFATRADELVRIVQTSGNIQNKQKLHRETIQIHGCLLEFVRVSKTMVF